MSERDSKNLAIQCELDDIQRAIEDVASSTHDDRFDLLGEPDDITKSIEYTNIALTLTADNNPGLPCLLANLGTRHGKRYNRLGEMHDSDNAIEYTSLSLALTPDGDPALPGRLANLGVFHADRFVNLGDLDGLDKAIDYKSRAAELTPDEHPHLPSRLNNLAISYTDRFQRLGELGDLHKAIEYLYRALALTPDGHPHLPIILTSIGVSLKYRFQHLGELADLDQAIDYESRALSLTPDRHPLLSRRHTNLGLSHRCRFERLGELDDLEKSIEHHSRALSLTPNDHPELPTQLDNLATDYRYRFERLDELGDLDKALKYQSRALELIPDGHPDLSYRLVNLGLVYRCRFERLRELCDLEKALEYQSGALSMMPDNHPDLAALLANLGLYLKHRFESLGELGDLNKAIEYESRVLALTPNGHPRLPDLLHNLGESHSRRFQRLGEQEDFEKVIECMSCAVQLTPDGHPKMSNKHHHLATFRFLQYCRTGDLSLLWDSLHSYRMASQSLAGSPRIKFRCAFGWARVASRESCLNCIEAYQTTINLLPQFIWLGASTTQRYHDLEEAQNLGVSAARAAILSSQYGLALEWLEHTRCVVWSQKLRLISAPDQLFSSHPALASRLRSIAAQLHRASSESRESQALSTGSLTPEQVAKRQRQLAQEYNDMLTQARSLPGFEDFLQPMKANRIINAARYGPVVVINCHQDRCDALVIMPRQANISHIPLPNFTGEKAQYTRLEMEKLVRSSWPRERGTDRRPVIEKTFDFERVLTVLWYNFVKPVLDSLGYTDKIPGDNLPHTTWCPTGILSFVPLHAAGDYDKPRSRVYDYVISSYTPILTTLLTSIPSSLAGGSGVLSVGQPNTPGHSPLPGTAKELACVKKHTSGKAKYSQLLGDQATTTAVLEAMAENEWVHLACHAHQNVSDPTKSGFFLHNGTLDLVSITQQTFKKKGLAYLSACQTATGDERLPDEAIHLASAMLIAGYSSVIATMWSVMDDDAPSVADKIYSQLMKDGKVGNGEPGKALHYAVAELREQVGEKEFGRWVLYIHIGS
ncbi:hypothetical protein OPQ81_002171 [Rhizoctonia solani]|nr:hypothetical protein OPQ81_002171 [Rhizoctonia solani]